MVNFDLQVMHLDSSDARMKNETQNQLDTKYKIKKQQQHNDRSFSFSFEPELVFDTQLTFIEKLRKEKLIRK